MSGIFTISLDFELHWGGFEKWPLKIQDSRFKDSDLLYDEYFLNTRKAIPEMLQLFGEYNVHVTWASVGMLFHKNRENLLKAAPTLKPSYQNHELSAYGYMGANGIGLDESTDPFHFAHSIVQQIIKTANQELASHTFSHFYCNEAGQTVEQFRADLKAAQQSAALHGKKLSSLVFPRNQFNDDYLKVCFEEGFTSVRSNPADWFWHIESTQHESAWKRLNRGLDAYFSVGKKNSYPISSIQLREGFPLCIPASRLLRPYRPKEFFLNQLKIERIKDEMTRAAQSNEVYHLWWHPHNFGWHPKESIAGLEEILKAYKNCNEKFGMTSLNMNEVTETVYSLNGKNKAA